MNMSSDINTLGILMNGVDGFFKPRFGAAWDINAKVPLDQAGFYDTSPLKITLEKYVDFDYLNKGSIRLSVCAVDIDVGQGIIFDSKKDTITAEHIMASGALPPGFPPVKIGDRAYWDGGVYSNTPMEVFLSEERNDDALCFMIDLWDPTESRPTSIADAMTRYKSIQYASRSKEQLQMHQKVQDMQRAIRELSMRLPPAERKKAELAPFIKMGCDHTVNVVHLIMKALPGDHYFKDVDFSTSTVQTRWDAGIHDCKRALKHKSWLQPLPPHAGLMIHELPQE
jgi:NTE family protein